MDRVVQLSIPPLWLLLLAGLAAAQPATLPLSGRIVATLELPPDNGLFMPNAIASGAHDQVAVVDGVNDRVVVFDASGAVIEEIRQLGAEVLSQPSAAQFDSSGRLWIADAGNARVLVSDGAGGLLRELRVPPGLLAEAPDLAGLTLSADGDLLWLVDNNHHRLIRYDLAADAVRVIGGYGESLGEFHYPYSAVTDAGGELLVIDVINGRVQRLSADGVPTGSIAAYGVAPGQVYRPKGVALDSQGLVWISDSTLGVVQAFSADGRLVGILRDSDGALLRFQHPMGLAFDSRDNLLVVELSANRVAKVALTRNPAAPPPTVPRERSATLGRQGRACTACHFEWMQPIVDGVPTELTDVPPNPADAPYVSTPDSCLGCHDGGVGDSRRRVWIEHGHKIGIVPPESMTIPEHMPLAAGKIACRTCHSAHASAESRTALETIVFLRTDGPPAELCGQCHSDYLGGLSHGMHPLADMPVEMPAALIHFDTPEAHTRVTCLGCHTGHGGRHDALLVLDPQSNELCRACHEPMAPELFADGHGTPHSQMPVLDAGQRAFVDDLGVRRGPGDELLCTTCHLAHRAPAARLLAFDLSQRDACAECHPNQQGVVASPHDLRESHPEVRNTLDTPLAEAGACGACHTAHRGGLPPNPTAVDSDGQCTNCHFAGGLAEDRQLGDVNHPDAACADCHNPHEARFGHFLIKRPGPLCASCHEQYAAVRGGPHDVTMNTDSNLWPNVSLAAADECLACHTPHGSAAGGLFRAGRALDAEDVNAACVVCHQDAASRTTGTLALLHPRDVKTLANPPDLPYSKGPRGDNQVSCNTCHDPHRHNADTFLLRVADNQTAEEQCLRCHAQRSNVHAIGHAEQPLAARGFQVGACRPCHTVHNDPDAVELPIMWPKSLLDYPGAADVAAANHYCAACHHEGGPVAPPAIATHPEAQMYNPQSPDDPGYLPLFNERGAVDPAGSIGCRTCHLTHGRETPAPLPAGLTADSERELRARLWHIRSVGVNNVCSTCHGFDALRRFMYFHDPQRRGGPIETAANIVRPGPAQ